MKGVADACAGKTFQNACFSNQKLVIFGMHTPYTDGSDCVNKIFYFLRLTDARTKKTTMICSKKKKKQTMVFHG